MKLTRLRLTGFKSFVEPADFIIEDGLTGVVGPNGCGKSNLVEALRWVMGESSFKNMRASGMDDVIFAGSGGRPARNHAEVVLTIDNAERMAPAAFNDSDILEVSRKIERDEGSTYRINGREVRARDVQLLFADAATGARSAAMVRQGQIGEIIAAKPQARRRILEDAAGIAGLHSRRHEAELRLRAADDNLARLDDVLGEIDSQIDGLKRQARQAARYRALAAEIRRQEGLVQAIGYTLARDQAADAERVLEAETGRVAERAAEQTRAARDQAVAAAVLPERREAEARAAAALQRLVAARDALEGEEKRARDRVAELEKRLSEVDRDARRLAQSRDDAVANLARLEAERATLINEGTNDDDRVGSARDRLSDAEADLVEAEATLTAVQGETAHVAAQRNASEKRVRDERSRLERISAEKLRVERELVAAMAGEDLADLRDHAIAAAEAAQGARKADEDQVDVARAALQRAREAETAVRKPLADAEREVQRLDTEIRTLRKLVAPAAGARFTPVLDEIEVDKGFEIALAAALGDDLDASTDPASPLAWQEAPGAWNPSPLPEGTTPLLAHVRAPLPMARRLSQIGICDADRAPSLVAMLRPGQRLVSPAGDLWRWDGLTARSEAPSAAARRLAERNRLVDLEAELLRARDGLEAAKAAADERQVEVREAALAEAAALDRATTSRRAADQARDALAAAERRLADQTARTAALREAATRLATDLAAAELGLGEAEAALSALRPAADLELRLAQARAQAGEKRAAAAEARAALQAEQRDIEQRASRLAAVDREAAQWRQRRQEADQAQQDLAERHGTIERELTGLREAPDLFRERRRVLLDDIEAAEAARRTAADALASAERDQAEADRAARAALDMLAAAREARAAAEARRDAAAARLSEMTRAIAESLETTPEALRLQTGLADLAALPDLAQVETKLSELKLDRERLGAVNLRADDELVEVEAKRASLVNEREDLTLAIGRLRQAISSLNREGRERLAAAFDVVNGHFQRLFTQLFGGGEAELSLVDSDDPLEAGLEIVARPPGKKPQTMTLLSGGEQALTATALIFAVFLTNPSPICVLDEVDAPLDDANVERYCDLLDEMARQTSTRFIVITHNPITMARMNRLFGVTMAERGVSDLVSVDLQMAEALREAV